eukprot:7926727-Prorocentrum_lima.AAC.1
MTSSLVGSEMCIRDSATPLRQLHLHRSKVSSRHSHHTPEDMHRPAQARIPTLWSKSGSHGLDGANAH